MPLFLRRFTTSKTPTAAVCVCVSVWVVNKNKFSWEKLPRERERVWEEFSLLLFECMGILPRAGKMNSALSIPWSLLCEKTVHSPMLTFSLEICWNAAKVWVFVVFICGVESPNQLISLLFLLQECSLVRETALLSCGSINIAWLWKVPCVSWLLTGLFDQTVGNARCFSEIQTKVYVLLKKSDCI